MHPRIEGILTELARVRAELTGVIESTPAAAFQVRTDRARWNGAELVHHMGAVEGSTAKLLEGLFAKALAEGLPADPETSSLLHSLDYLHVPDRSFRQIVAPERLRPPADANLATAWESLQRVRERTHRAVATVDGRDLSRISAPHPAFGPINGYQWVLFIGQHEERHLRQLRETLGVV